ncbi:MAG: hypothetical protein IJA90_10510 [Peptococcaceae bacterium]|nr:hypothetical protein [Peptococcaceae bacterium]
MKKLATMAISVGLIGAMVAGGSLAYLTSEDSDVNVMTLGNVKIEQLEQERADDGSLTKFTQGKPAMPAVGPIEWAENGVTVNEVEYKMFTPELKNVIDKIVTVENKGNSDAYVRTIVAIEAPGYDQDNLIHFNYNATDVAIGDPVNVAINGVDFVVFDFTYNDALKAKEKSAPSLMQLFLDSKATNEDCAKFGDTWEVLVLSQAVQTAGFENETVVQSNGNSPAATALNTAFGEVNTTNVVKWFADMQAPTLVDNSEEVYQSTLENGNFTLTSDINTSDADNHYSGNREYAITGARDYTINLNGHTINHDGTYQDGKNTGYTYLYTTAYNGKLTINGEGTINSANSEGCASVFYAQGPSEIVINGVNVNVDKGIAVWAGKNGKVTINGGSFVSTGSAGDEELIYSSGGVIDIYGGFFHNKEWENRPVNVADANRSTGFINIYGGTFVNFDPSTGGNDPGNIKVMDGYKVVSETQANGDIWYTVVAE